MTFEKKNSKIYWKNLEEKNLGVCVIIKKLADANLGKLVKDNNTSR